MFFLHAVCLESADSLLDSLESCLLLGAPPFGRRGRRPDLLLFLEILLKLELDSEECAFRAGALAALRREAP